MHFIYFRIKLLLMLCLTLTLFSGATFAFALDQSRPTAGQNKIRTEHELRIIADYDKGPEIWDYLNKLFIADPSFLLSLSPNFTAKASEEQFYDTYYDNSELALLSTQGGVRYRKRFNLSDPSDPKNGRELIQIKISNADSSNIDRKEIKFDVDPKITAVSNNGQVGLLRMVKPSLRSELQARLQALDIDVNSLYPIFTISDLRKRIYIYRDQKAFMSITIDNVIVSAWWATVKFCELESEPGEIVYTDADPKTKVFMQETLNKIVARFKHDLPYLKEEYIPKYNRSFSMLEQQVPYYRILVKFNLHHTDNMWLLLMIILIIIGFIGYTLYNLINKFRKKRKTHGA